VSRAGVMITWLARTVRDAALLLEELTLLRLGDAYERATAWHRRRPVLP